MIPLEADIAWHRQKAQETLEAIERVTSDPPSSSRTAELQILTETLGWYIMTADMLERAGVKPPKTEQSQQG